MRRGYTRISSFDPRLKILLTICFGLLTWMATYWVVLCYLALILLLSFRLEKFWSVNRTALFSLGLLIVFWVSIKLLLGLLSAPGSLDQVLFPTLKMGTRLLTVLLLGLCLATSSSVRQIGLACNWFLRPCLGKKSWQGALTLSLMLHFIPLTFKTLQQGKLALRFRNPRLFFLHRQLMLFKLCLRVLSNKTWTQAVALAARGLDQPNAWNEKLDFSPKQWILGAFVLVLGLLTYSL